MSRLDPGTLSLIWPLLAQVLLTFVSLGIMGSRRVAALRARDVRMADVAVSGEAFPEKARQAANNFSNQFETPVLFYVLVFAAILVGATGWVMVLLAWAYVATRVAHMAVHVGANDVRLRFNIFAAGTGILLAMTLAVAITAL